MTHFTYSLCQLEERLLRVQSVVDVHDLHIWQITMGKTLLACHLRIDVDADSEDVSDDEMII